MGKKSKNPRKSLTNQAKKLAISYADLQLDMLSSREAPPTQCRHYFNLTETNPTTVRLLQLEIKEAVGYTLMLEENDASDIEDIMDVNRSHLMLSWGVDTAKLLDVEKMILAKAADHLLEFGYDKDNGLSRKFVQSLIVLYHCIIPFHDNGMIAASNASEFVERMNGRGTLRQLVCCVLMALVLIQRQ